MKQGDVIQTEEIANIIMQNKDILGIVMGRAIPFEEAQASFLPELVRLYSSFISSSKPIQNEESLAVTLSKPKTCALLFDRVWAPASLLTHNSICFFGKYVEEIRIASQYDMYCSFWLNLWNDHAKEIIQANNLSGEQIRGVQQSLDNWDSFFSRHVIKRASQFFTQEVGQINTPIYSRVSDQQHDFQPGDLTAIVAVIEQMQLVDEKVLTWKQVEEFRKDDIAKKKYKRFMRWLDNSMMGKSQMQIVDEISIILDDYSWALKKHGVQTVLGTLTRLLDYKMLAAGAISALVTPSPLLGLLSLGIFAAANTAITVAEIRLKREDVHHQYGDIAYVYELEKRFGSR